MAEATETLEIRVFTHPACGGCPEAVKLAWEVAGSRPGLDLRTVSLVGEEGLAEARAAGVTTIPTLVLVAGGREVGRWTGTPEREELAAAVDGIAVSPSRANRASGAG